MGVADFAFELGKDIDLTNNEISNLLTIMLSQFLEVY